jgi:glycosyltransferase involved in cell wall biosynthesis
VIASFPPVIRQNPYQRLLYAHLAKRGFRLAEDGRFKLDWLWAAKDTVGILHFHWPEGYYLHREGPARLRPILSWARLPLFSARLVVARLLGYRIVWTVHQVRPHESRDPRQDRWGVRVLSRAAEILIAHDRVTAEQVRAELPRASAKLAIVPHGSYLGVYPAGRSRDTVRAELGIPAGAFVFLCFGHVRAYKELGLLLEAFSTTHGDDLILLLAGLPIDERSAEEARGRAERDHRVHLLLEFIPDDRVAELFEASDVAVLPRSDGGTSGALILALSLGLPVIAAATPTYEELLVGGEAGWLFEPGNPSSLGSALGSAAHDRTLADLKKVAASAQAERLSWGEAADRTAALFRTSDQEEATPPPPGLAGESVAARAGTAS